MESTIETSRLAIEQFIRKNHNQNWEQQLDNPHKQFTDYFCYHDGETTYKRKKNGNEHTITYQLFSMKNKSLYGEIQFPHTKTDIYGNMCGFAVMTPKNANELRILLSSYYL